MIFGALGEVALGDSGSGGIVPSSIASAEAFGTPSISADATIIIPTSIASAETFGNLEIVLTVAPTSIDSAEAFGEPLVYQLYTYEPLSRV